MELFPARQLNIMEFVIEVMVNSRLVLILYAYSDSFYNKYQFNYSIATQLFCWQ